jgi:hypothetical protein
MTNDTDVDDLAALLNGRAYGSEVTNSEASKAHKDGLVVVYGYSDDVMQVCGAISAIGQCADGQKFKIHSAGILADWERMDKRVEAAVEQYFKDKAFTKDLEAVWDVEGYSWVYKTDISHATFEIFEDGEKYCRGIVFSAKHLSRTHLSVGARDDRDIDPNDGAGLIQLALDYANWLVVNGRGTSFSAFVNEFPYDHIGASPIYERVLAIIHASRAAPCN